MELSTWWKKGRLWITPEWELKYKNISKKRYPERWIICYHDYLIRLARRKFGIKKIERKADCNLYEFNYKKRMGIIRSGIGAPMAALILEGLIVRGLKYVLNIGLTGSLQYEKIKIGDIVLCTKAIRREGTSSYYLRPSRYAYPDKKLTSKVERVLRRLGIPYWKGPTISLDAPYRFPVREVSKLRAEGVITSEMEAAAIFAVAKLRRVKAASIFTISDLATKDFRWIPRFHAPELREGLKKLLRIAVETLAT